MTCQNDDGTSTFTNFNDLDAEGQTHVTNIQNAANPTNYKPGTVGSLIANRNRNNTRGNGWGGWGDFSQGTSTTGTDPSKAAGGGANKRNDPAQGLGSVIASAISAYFNSVNSGGTPAEAKLAAKKQLANGLSGVLTQMVAGFLPGGIIGQIGGALIGGVLTGLINKALGVNKAVKRDTPTYSPVMNALDYINMFTLGNSAYFQPTGRNTGPVQFYQNNTINVEGGVKQATRLQSALTDPELLGQLNRGLV